MRNFSWLVRIGGSYAQQLRSPVNPVPDSGKSGLYAAGLKTLTTSSQA